MTKYNGYFYSLIFNFSAKCVMGKEKLGDMVEMNFNNLVKVWLCRVTLNVTRKKQWI
jgi:hypothetical protein